MELSLPESIIALLIIGVVFAVMFTGPAKAGEVVGVLAMSFVFGGVTFSIGVLHGKHRSP